MKEAADTKEARLRTLRNRAFGDAEQRLGSGGRLGVLLDHS